MRHVMATAAGCLGHRRVVRVAQHCSAQGACERMVVPATHPHHPFVQQLGPANTYGQTLVFALILLPGALKILSAVLLRTRGA